MAFPQTAILTLAVCHSAALRPVLLEMNHLSDLHREKKHNVNFVLQIFFSTLLKFQAIYKLVRHTHKKCVYESKCVWLRRLTVQHFRLAHQRRPTVSRSSPDSPLQGYEMAPYSKLTLKKCLSVECVCVVCARLVSYGSSLS